MLGLVLEGGASRTYYSIGVLDAFVENGIEADVVVGVSAGIANGMSYVSRQKGRALELGMKYACDKRYMGMKYFFKKGNRSYYNIDFVFGEIPDIHLPFDSESYNSFPGDVYAVLTDVETGKSEYTKINDYENSRSAVLASCSLPLMFQAVKIDGKSYMDGGCSDPLPVEFAFGLGCDKVITILTRERSYQKDDKLESFASSFLFRKNKEFSRVLSVRGDIYNKSREYIFEKEKEGRAFVFAPKNTVGWKRNEKNPQKLLEIYNEGYNNAIKRMDELKNFIKD